MLRGSVMCCGGVGHLFHLVLASWSSLLPEVLV